MVLMSTTSTSSCHPITDDQVHIITETKTHLQWAVNNLQETESHRRFKGKVILFGKNSM
jgi:hypothetical protein